MPSFDAVDVSRDWYDTRKTAKSFSIMTPGASNWAYAICPYRPPKRLTIPYNPSP
jgi:hypothetical protein